MSLRTERALQRTIDPETGCMGGSGDNAAYELCRQNYFAKQQNQILLQQQKTQPSNQENKTTTTIAQPIPQSIDNNIPRQFEVDGNTLALYGTILILVVALAVIITKNILKAKN